VRVRPAVAFLLALVMVSAAGAERIEIDTGGDPESRLEIRNVVLPGGAEVQLYVIEGEQVRVTIGERQLIAEHIEVDLTNRLVRIIGFGTFITPDQTVQGENLTIELEEESLTGRDVLIITEAIDVRGVEATRAPGQINVIDGSFSPCSRCKHEVEDYGFRAGRIELYPGDRLVAFDVVVLVRGLSLLELPLLVVPLARPDRQPRLSISQGSATERAEVALDWPYVAGPNAYGTFSVRYHADIDPAGGGWPQPLGGQVVESYLGGGVAHVFYTDRGQGEFGLFYRPGFLDGTGGRERPQFSVRFAYATQEEALGDGSGEPGVDAEIERDDARRDRLLEYRVELGGAREGLRGTFQSQGFVDIDPEDDVDTPSYDDRATPRRTPVRITLEPEEERFTVGPLLLRRLTVDLGLFEDASNPSNRSAAGRTHSEGGRLLERHSLELTPVTLWSGLELRGNTNFTGYYYTTGERQIDWDTQVSAEQRFTGVGSFGLVFTRDVNEGETPFRFDQIPLRTRTDLRGELRLEPLPWLSFEASDTYVFRDTRRPELEGFLPLESRLELFGNLAWLDASVANSYDIEAGDPGNLDFELILRSPETTPRASLEIDHLADLAVRPDRLTGEPTNESATTFALSYGLPALRVDASGGFRYHPPAPEEPDEPLEYWQPFVAGLTVGTLEQDDALPGLQLAYERDLNRRRLAALRYDARARIGALQLTAVQRFDLPEGGTTSSTVTVLYPGIARLDATGFTLVRPTWLGLPEGEPQAATYTVALRDAPLSGAPVWELRYQTRYDPQLNGDTGGLSRSALEARVELEDEQVGGTRFGVDFFADVQLRDDALETSYLRRASLELGVDIEGLVGVQGALGYRGILNTTTGELSRAELILDEVAITVKAREDLFVGAIFDDVWDFTGLTADQPAFDLRPELFVVWDRCCWALMGGWNTETGQLRVSITAPGADQGLTQFIETPLVLPGRGTP
jgi:hypothetical protein